MLLQTPETHLNSQEIVYLANINEVLDYIFTDGLEIPNLLTGIGSYASTHPYAFYISASKFDKWMKSWRNCLSCSKLDSTKPVMVLSPSSPLAPSPPPPPSALEGRTG